jgi:hypothetical protein
MSEDQNPTLRENLANVCGLFLFVPRLTAYCTIYFKVLRRIFRLFLPVLLQILYFAVINELTKPCHIITCPYAFLAY